MKFRPCIDLHCGVVKQIVGSTLSEDAASAGPVENFVASKPAAEYAQQYQRDGLYGGHVIMLGPNCEDAALDALRAFPGGLQIGGGITLDNAMRYLDAGASHVVVTSFVFRDGQVDLARLQALRDLVGKERLVIDLSCRKRPEDAATPDAPYYVVTNKWTQVCERPTDRRGRAPLLLIRVSLAVAVHVVRGGPGEPGGVGGVLQRVLGARRGRRGQEVRHRGGAGDAARPKQPVARDLRRRRAQLGRPGACSEVSDGGLLRVVHQLSW